MALKNYTAYDGDGNEYSFQGDEGLTHDEIADVVDRMQPTKKASSDNTTSLWEDVKSGLAGAASAADFYGNNLLAQMMAGQTYLHPERAGGVADVQDKLFKAQAEREQALRKWANPKNKEQGIGGKVVSAIPQIPTFAFSPATTGKIMIDNGESLNTAQMGTLLSTAGNVASVGIPGNWGSTLTKKMLTGAATNAGQQALQNKIIQELATNESTKKAFANNPEDLLASALIGAGISGISHLSTREQPTLDEHGSFADQAKNIILQEEATRQEQSPQTKQLYVNDLDPTIRAAQEGLNRQAQYDSVHPTEEQVQVDHTNQQELPLTNDIVDKTASNNMEESPYQRDLFDTTNIEQRYQEDTNARNAQDIINQRQQALEDQVRQQTSLDLNAQERGRRDLGTSGPDDLLANEYKPPISIPKNQRGGVDMDAIIKSIGEASDRVTEAFKGLGKFSPTGSSSNKQAGWIANHPGFAGKDVDAINPKPLPFEDVRDKLLSTPDTSKIYSSIASGATLLS